ncbi:GtrA family protein [Weizmannia acidilactici]|uniref:GtrA family protein n=1 Tax=Weizmannia acidilactici TaxID=2607726 RepID=UPI00124D197B|nr:GtrA family protein [Weizmannia acidilactici]GER73462.1 hypothetical protein BpPP18_15290 [Weizmannia acidilactici]
MENIVLSGGSCALIDLRVLYGFLSFFPSKQPFWLAFWNSVAYGLAVLNSYYWNSRFTFKAKKNPKQFIAFITQAAASLLIADFIFVSGIYLFGIFAVFLKWIGTAVSKLASMFL